MNRWLPVVSQYSVWFFILWMNRRSIWLLFFATSFHSFQIKNIVFHAKSWLYLVQKTVMSSWRMLWFRAPCLYVVGELDPVSSSEYLISIYANTKSPWIKSLPPIFKLPLFLIFYSLSTFLWKTVHARHIWWKIAFYIHPWVVVGLCLHLFCSPLQYHPLVIALRNRDHKHCCGYRIVRLIMR